MPTHWRSELLRGDERRPAPAEGVEHDVAGLELAETMRSRSATGFCVGQPSFSFEMPVDIRDVGPDVTEWHAR